MKAKPTKSNQALKNKPKINKDNGVSITLKESLLLLDQRNAELAVINSVQQGLAAEMDMQGIYDLVGDRLRNLFDAQVTGIYSFDHNAGLEQFHYLFEDGERLYPESRPLNEIRKWMIKNKSLILVNKDADNDIYKITNAINSVVPGTRIPKSMLFVPLMVGSQVKGCVSLQNLDRENAFSDSDVRLLSTLANSMSVALENARLFNETEQRNAELAVINSVQEGLVAEMDLQGIYDLVGNKTRELFDAQAVIIATFNHENNTEIFNYVFEDGKRFYPEARVFDNIRQRLIETQKLIHIQENAVEAFKILGVDDEVVPGTKLPKTMLYVPLIIGDTVRGYVSLQNLDKEHAFSDSDVRLLSTLANSMSVALENARLFNETEQRNAELAVINSVQEGLVAEMDMQGIYDLVGDKIRNLFDAQVVSMCTFNYENSTEEFNYMYEDGERYYLELRPIDKVRQKLIDTKELICINENADEEWTKITGEEPTVIPGTKLTKSVLFVPMIVGSEVRGYVSLQNVDREHAFSDSDVRLLSTLANSMSVALENARLFNETEQRNAELAVINSVQEGLVAEMDMQGIYDLVGDKTKELFDSQVTVIATFDHESHKEHFNYVFEDGKRFYPEPRTIDNIRQSLIETQKLIHVNENKRVIAAPGTKVPKTMLYVPLIIGDTVRGYVSLQNLDKANAFSDSDVRLLSTLANSMSVALENARLFNETEQRNAELAVINSVQAGLVAEMDMQGIYDLVGDKTRELFNSQVTIIATFDHENHKEQFNYIFEDGKRFYPEARTFDNIRQRLIDTQKLIHIKENAVDALKKLGASTKAGPGTKFPKTMLFVPLIIGDTVRGYVSLQNLDKENAFSDSDVRLLSTLANSMSVALENARLFNETEQRNAELAVINSVQEGLVAEMDMQGIYDLVGNKTRELFDSQVTIISTFDHESKKEHFNYFFEDGKRVNPQPRPFDKVRELLITTKKLINVNENVKQAYTKITGKAPAAVPGTKFPKSVLFVPLIIGDTVRGYVSLQNIDKENAFSDSDVRLLSTLANSMSVALENARLFNETEQRNAELAVINSVQAGLVAEMDMQGIYDLVGDKTMELFNAQAAIIATFNHENNTEIFNYTFEDGKRINPQPRPFDKIRQRLITTKKLMNINENSEQVYTAITGKPPIAVPGTKFAKSMLFVPLIIGDTVRGYVSLQNVDRENAFSDSDVRLLSTLANSMSVALENARLFNETEQRNAELAVINSVQEGLVAEMDMQGIYDLVGNKTRELFDAQAAIIASFNYENNTEIFNYVFEDGKHLTPLPRPFDKIRQRLITSKKLININENSEQVYTTITGKAPTAVPDTIFPKSMLYVPLIIGDTVRGYVSLQNIDKENAFSDSDVRLLSTLANSMSVALENARLFSETEQRNAELAVINSVQEGLVAEMDMQGIYDLVGNKTKELFDSQVTVIANFDHDNQKEHFNYVFEDGKRFYPEPRTFDNIRKNLIKTQKLIHIYENANEALDKIGVSIKAAPGTKLPKTMLYVPLIIGDTVRGYVSLQNLDKEHAFSDSDVRLLSTLANSMSVALENARLFNETEQRNAELAVINSVQEGLVAEMDMQGIYDLVGDKIRNLFDAQVTSIVTFNYDHKSEKFQYLFEDGERLFPDTRPYDELRSQLIINRKTLLINENAAEVMSKINGKPFKPLDGTRMAKSALYVPMVVGNSVLGYVSLQNLDRENAFSESDVSLLNTLVNSMTVALENARLFNETTRLLAETEQRNAEFAVINSVQEGLVGEMEDMHAIYLLVASRVCQVLNTQTILIRTFDHTKGLEHWEYVVENGVQLFSEPRPFIWANKHLIKTKESLLINENYLGTAQQYGDKSSGVSKGLPPKSAIFVPMIVGDTVMGSVSLQNVEKENAFTESDVRLLSTLTNSMSVAIQNARLFNETTRLLAETEQRATELQTVNNISIAMVSLLEFDALIKLVGDQMRETFKADIVYLALHDLKTNMLHFPYMYGDILESRLFTNGITEKIITTKEPLLINQKMDEAVDKIKVKLEGIKVQSYLGVPIIAGSKAIGVISVQSKELENVFDEYDQRLLTTIAANLGIAIQNAEAYQKLQAALTELRAAQQQLVQSEKMASLGELTAGIAHEIQNPLNFVNNFSEVSDELLDELAEEVKDSGNSEIEEIISDLKQNLSKINHHGRRASSIVKGMLDHSRTSNGIKVLTDINILADEYLRLSYHGLRAKDKSFNADFKTNLDATIPKISVVPQDFGRVILNLINNAFYAVTKKAKETPEGYQPTVTVVTKKVMDGIEIRVKDNGNGIPNEIADKIFQPFFTTKPSGEGTGLGLSLAYDIVTKGHGGKLILDSKKGIYTEFTIVLPIDKKQ